MPMLAARRVHRSATPRRCAAIVALLLVALASLPDPAASLAATTASVRIGDALDPKELGIAPGTTVTWTNESGNRHRMRSTDGPTEFDSGDLEPGESFSVTFPTVGTITYRDERNKDSVAFAGRIVVAKEATASPSPGTPAPTPTPATSGDVGMAARTFSPGNVTIAAGGSVTWVNDDDRDHTVTATSGGFDSGTMAPGASWSRTFPAAGTFPYLCAIHPDMTGTVTVLGAGGATPPPPSPTPVPTPTPPQPSAAPNGVTILDFAFRPSSLSVTAGTRVTWTNADVALHTVTADDGSFDSANIAKGGTYARTFSVPGTFRYTCVLHPEMTGTVLVSDGTGATPPPASPRPSPTPRPSSPPGALTIVDYAYRPSSITVAAGTTLTWVNTGAAPHTVTDEAARFDSGTLSAGARWSHTFSTPGTFRYLCTLHPQMRATVIVPGATGSAPPPPPPSAAAPATSTAPAPPGTTDVRIVDLAYEPADLAIPPGTTVRWVNEGIAPHTVTDASGAFDSGFLATGQVWEQRFETLGTVRYLCTIHPQMTGTITVTAGAQVPGAPAAPGSDGAAPPEGAPGSGTAGADVGNEPGSGSDAGGGSGADDQPAPAGGTRSPDPFAAARVLAAIGLSAAAVALFGRVLAGVGRPHAEA